MNLDLKDIFKKLGGKHKKTMTRVFSPEHDWGVMLALFAIANILVIAWSAYLFLFAQSFVDQSAVQSPSPVASQEDKMKVNDILSSFQAKQSSTTIILQQKPVIADPS